MWPILCPNKKVSFQSRSLMSTTVQRWTRTHDLDHFRKIIGTITGTSTKLWLPIFANGIKLGWERSAWSTTKLKRFKDVLKTPFFLLATRLRIFWVYLTSKLEKCVMKPFKKHIWLIWVTWLLTCLTMQKMCRLTWEVRTSLQITGLKTCCLRSRRDEQSRRRLKPWFSPRLTTKPTKGRFLKTKSSCDSWRFRKTSSTSS